MPRPAGGIPAWLGSALVCLTVLTYVFSGGMRSLSFANALHATVLILLGGVILFLVLDKLGGAAEATKLVAMQRPELLIRGAGKSAIGQWEFFTYMFVPLSVGMFPHLFQHWMTAKDVKTFRSVVILHPIFIMLVWAPCILLGIWASTAVMPDGKPVVDLLTLKSPNEVLGIVVNKLTNPVVAGFLGVGIVSATMSLDSQFLALSSMFTHDILLRIFGEKRIGDKQRILLGRSMVVAIVVAAYVVSLFAGSIYTLGVWCFSGFAGMFPLVFAALYWKRVTSNRGDRFDHRYCGDVALPVRRFELGQDGKALPGHDARRFHRLRFRSGARRRLARHAPAGKGSGRTVLPQGGGTKEDGRSGSRVACLSGTCQNGRCEGASGLGSAGWKPISAVSDLPLIEATHALITSYVTADDIGARLASPFTARAKVRTFGRTIDPPSARVSRPVEPMFHP